MEAHARAPDPLLNGEDWYTWKEDFIIFMKVAGYIDKPNEIRANLLKNRIGKIGIDAINNMSFDNPQDKDDMDILITKLEKFFKPPKNEMVERYNFFTMSKFKNVSIEHYINNLRERAKTCNFKDTVDDIIRDKIISDTRDKILLDQYLKTDSLDLQKLITIYNDYEINTEKIKQLTREDKTKPENITQKPSTNPNDAKKPCWRCDHHHPPKKCFAWESTCKKCNDKHHFTHCCKNKIDFRQTKPNNDKINKNVQYVSPMQPQTKVFPKISLPDVPTTSFDFPNASVNSGSDIASDYIVVDSSTNPSFHYNNTSQSTYLSEKSQYKSEGKTTPNQELKTYLHNKSKKTQSKPLHANTSQEMKNFENIPIHKAISSFQQTKPNQKKKNEENCILS